MRQSWSVLNGQYSLSENGFWLINKNFQIGLDNLGLDIVLMNLLANTNQSFCRSTSHFVDHDNIGSTPT